MGILCLYRPLEPLKIRVQSYHLAPLSRDYNLVAKRLAGENSSLGQLDPVNDHVLWAAAKNGLGLLLVFDSFVVDEILVIVQLQIL